MFKFSITYTNDWYDEFDGTGWREDDGWFIIDRHGGVTLINSESVKVFHVKKI